MSNRTNRIIHLKIEASINSSFSEEQVNQALSPFMSVFSVKLLSICSDLDVEQEVLTCNQDCLTGQ